MAKEVTSITINYRDIIRVLRIITLVLLLLTAGIVSFVLVYYGIFSLGGYIGCLLLLILLTYLVLPVIFCFCPHLHQSMVFQPHVDAAGIDFEKPQDLRGVRNFKISDGTIGVWHILPSSLSDKSENQEASFWQDAVRAKGHNGVIVYFHGVTGTRGKWHRKELYKVLQDKEHHIISCDYRGFGDSTKVKRITESGVVDDALAVYQFVRQELLGGDTRIPVFIWGHSLGAGISSHAVAKLSDLITLPCPNGLVLESPFDNFGEELRNHAKLKIWRLLPFFDRLFVNPLRKSDIAFQNDHHISKISVPIMIMHAKDDNVVPSHLGKRLFEAGRYRPNDFNPLYFVHMKAGKHNEMYKLNAEFGKIITLFTDACMHACIPITNLNLNRNSCWHHDCSVDAEIVCSHC
ncbi:lysophosphatidylserine lipase ABHD12 [Folsomia candida]|uniref:lysophosphatidylserine lipase ABHD12 n=1 Tax=Folsomia candida TaxID=158441 RepID=UPI000B907006|nr:lysophosphatidylserine lipase ABHD12 [Folsomia candida]